MPMFMVWVQRGDDESDRQYISASTKEGTASAAQAAVLSASDDFKAIAVFNQVKTEDGYVLTLQEDLSWSDGDLSYPSLDDLAKDVDFEYIPAF